MARNSKRIAIFASGSGTNAENLIAHFKHVKDVEISLIVCNKSKAYVVQRAKNKQIPCLIIDNGYIDNSNKLQKELDFWRIDWIVLAGFLKKIPSELILQYPDKIVNIHPALLPKYGGKGMYGKKVHQAVKNNKDKETGITIHYVNEAYDEGPVIFQASCSVDESDSVEDIAKKVHALEYEHFPLILEKIIL